MELHIIWESQELVHLLDFSPKLAYDYVAVSTREIFTRECVHVM